MQDFTDELNALAARLDEATRYLRIDEQRQRRSALEAEMADPDLWNDQDRGRLGRQHIDESRMDRRKSSREDERGQQDRTAEHQPDNCSSSASQEVGPTPKGLQWAATSMPKRRRNMPKSARCSLLSPLHSAFLAALYISCGHDVKELKH